MTSQRKIVRGFLAAITLSGIAITTTQAANSPRIEYLLVLNDHDKPRTYFRPGARLAVRVELYFTARSAAGVKTAWRVTEGGRTVLHRLVHGKFHGPARGNLFTQTQAWHLPPHVKPGTYTTYVTVAVNGHHLSRNARFYVRR